MCSPDVHFITKSEEPLFSKRDDHFIVEGI